MSLFICVGSIYKGIVTTVPATNDPDYQTMIHWAHKYKCMSVYAITESMEQVIQAKAVHAEGLGVCK